MRPPVAFSSWSGWRWVPLSPITRDRGPCFPSRAVWPGCEPANRTPSSPTWSAVSAATPPPAARRRGMTWRPRRTRRRTRTPTEPCGRPHRRVDGRHGTVRRGVRHRSDREPAVSTTPYLSDDGHLTHRDTAHPDGPV